MFRFFLLLIMSIACLHLGAQADIDICAGESFNLENEIDNWVSNACGNNPDFEISNSTVTGIANGNVGNPNLTPGSSGSFDVEVFNGNNSCDNVSVTINYSAINAAFTFTQDNASDCYELSFTNTSTSTGGANITLYDWDFGFVGGDSNSASPTINFPQAGTYTVSLDITNSFGCTDNITQNITVQGANPSLDLIGNNFPLTLVSDLGDTCVFGFCVFGNNTNYVLNLDENSFVNYPGASISNVSVTDEQTGLVINPPVQITYPAAETGYAYFTVEVTDNFGCTTTKVFAIYKSNLQNLQYSCSQLGTESYCAGDVITFENEAFEANPADATYTVQFLCESTGEILFEQTWVDDPPQYFDFAPGSASCGCDNFDDFTIITNVWSPCDQVSNPGIQHFAAGYQTDPDFTFAPNPACAGETVNFDWVNAGSYLSAGPGPCRPNFDWTITDELGNNIPPQAGDFTPSMSHAFAQAGIYTIRFTIQTTCGTEFMEQTICIDAPSTPSVIWNFPFPLCEGDAVLPQLTHGPVNCTVPFIDWSVIYPNNTAVPAAYYTITNDGTLNPTITFNEKGIYRIRVNISNAPCLSPTTITSTDIIIAAEPIITASNGSIDVCSGEVVCLDPNFCINECYASLNDFIIEVYEGNVNCVNPSGTVVYSSIISPPAAVISPCSFNSCQYSWTLPANPLPIYTVVIYAQNACGNDQTCFTINVGAATDPVLPSQVCEGTVVNLNSLEPDPACNWQYWNGGTWVNAPASFTVNTQTQFRLTCPGFCPLEETIDIFPLYTLNAAAVPATICVGNTSLITATPNPINTLINNYDFQLGGLSQQNGASNTFSTAALNNPATYTVIATSNNGCIEQTTVSVNIDPQPIFNCPGFTFCETEIASIINVASLLTYNGSYPGAAIWDIDGWNFPGTTVTVGAILNEFGPIDSNTNYTLTYNYSTPNNCVHTGSCTITILNQGTSSSTIQFCALTNEIIPGNGTWSWIDAPPSNPAVGNYNGYSYTPSAADAGGPHILALNTGCNQTEFELYVNYFQIDVQAAPQLICLDAASLLTAIALPDSNIVDYSWCTGNCAVDLQDGLSNEYQTNSLNTNSTFTVTATDDAGCVYSDNITITIESNPVLNCASILASYCETSNDQIAFNNLLSLNGVYPVTATWTVCDNNIPGNSVNIQDIVTSCGPIDADTTVWLVYELTTPAGCFHTDSCSVNLLNQGNTDTDIDACFGVQLQLVQGISGFWNTSQLPAGAPLNFNGTTFNWTPPLSSLDGTYILTYESACNQVTYNITIRGFEINISTDDAMICEGASANLSVEITNGNAPSANYSFNSVIPNLNLQNGANNELSVSPAVATSYNVNVSDNFGCNASDQISVDVEADPILNCNALAASYCETDQGSINLTTLLSFYGSYPAAATWSLCGTDIIGTNLNIQWIVNNCGPITQDECFTLSYEFTTPNGCEHSGSCEVCIEDFVIDQFTHEICADSTLSLNGFGFWDTDDLPPSAGNSYNGNGFNWSPVPADANVVPYQLTLTNPACSSAEHEITVNPVPVVVTVANTSVCYNECITLSTAQFSGYTNFYWSIDGEIIQGDEFCPIDFPAINQGDQVQACLYAENEFGCNTIDCYTINIAELPGFPILPDPLCLNELLSLPFCADCDDYEIDFNLQNDPGVTLNANYPGNYTFPQAGDFDYTITSELGLCSDTQNGEIHIISLVSLTLLDDPLIYDSCHPDFEADFQITGEDSQYSWSEDQYVNLSNQNLDTYTFHFDYDNFIDTDTTYYNTIIVENACNQVSETIEIDHTSLPFFSLDTDPTYCHEIDEIFLVIHFNIPTTLNNLTISSDYTPIGNISLDSAPSDTLWFPAISAFVVDTVVITTVATNDCGQIALIDTILIYPPGFAMDLELTYTDPVCPGDTIVAEVIEYTGESSGIFFDFSTDYNLVPIGDNTYLIITDESLEAGFIDITVGIESTCGFTLDDESVEIGPFTAPYWYNDPECPGEQIQLWNQSNPINANFIWSMDGEVFSETTLPPLFTTFYFEDELVTLYAEYPGFCPAQYTDAVSIYEGITANFSYSPSHISVLDPEVEFNDLSDGAIDWDWEFIGLGGSSAPNPTFTFPDESEAFYTVCLDVLNIYGCADDICKDLWVQGEFQIFVPNTFTPDNNGLNDVFHPQMRGFDENEYELKIFDRWGDLIFETRNYLEPWIGNIHGGDYYAQNDVYLWIITVRDLQGVRHERKGHVTLVR